MDIQDLLNVDFERLAEMKEKCVKFIEVINSNESELHAKEESDKLLLFFAEKLNVKNYKKLIFYQNLIIWLSNLNKYFFLSEF